MRANFKFSFAAIAACVAVTGCAGESPLRLKAEGRLERGAMLPAEEPKPALAAAQLTELRQALRTAQPAPAKPAVDAKRFNLAVKDLAAAAAYQAIGEQTGLNVIVSPDIQERVTINLRNATAVEALETLREVYGFEFEFASNRIMVSKPKLSSRTFQLDYLVASRSGRSEVKVSSSGVGDTPAGSGAQGSTGSGGAQQRDAQEGSRVTTTIQNDFWRTIESVLKSIVGGKEGSIVVNPQSGLVFVRAMPAQLREIDEYLERTQSKVSRQVVLEAKIIQVTLSDGSQGGINWAAFDSLGNHRWSVGANGSAVAARGGALLGQAGASGVATQTPLSGAAGLLNAAGVLASAGGLGVAFTGASFSALMNFLQSQGEARVLSAPRVATLNNQKAVLKVGVDEYFVTNVSSTSVSTGSSTSSSPTINVHPFFSGIALDVTPQIDDQGFVTLHVHPSVSDVSEKNKTVNLGGMGVYNLPLASSSVNESDTIVRVLDGDIVAIGGLMSSSLYRDGNKVPLAGDVPIFGEFFRQHRDSYRKTELVILIKPTVINKPADWTSANPARGAEAR